MGTTKVRRVRVSARLSGELRARLTKYGAASGISETTIIEDALRKYLDSADDTALLLRRFDRVERALARDHRDLELLSEAFGRYLRLWFQAQAPNPNDAGRPLARSAAATQYAQFAQHLGAGFAHGHRFVDDLPAETFAGEDKAT
jgi:predicted DNA-binding protein